ncbi:ATP-binding cassette domain-containing protein [Leucobacter sp. W1153]|uniref:ATP-binding cassette domain-containing protein n=1 Tax=Leucobacter sp. W1153 TaxID=3439064 RepID=UPI003F2FC287
MSAVLARVESLTVRFPGHRAPAVDGVSLVVHAGECVALVGESGSGKSLTARALLGLLPRTAIATHTSLEIVSPGGTLGAAPEPGHRRWDAIRGAHGSLIPQDALGALDPLRRVEHEVGDALRLHGLATGAERRHRVLAALNAAGMPEPARHLRQRSDELSGGLRQRALVATALIADPEFIVADEPTTALDAGHRGNVLARLRQRVDQGCGVLLITHDLASVRGVADRVLVMRHGRIIEAGEPSRVLTQPTHPFTRELLESSPAGKPRGVRLTGEFRSPGASPEPADPTPAAPIEAPRATCAPRLELADISVSFGTHQVLRRVSLELAAGETVGLVGESGSGKTTLLRVALGLQSPAGGTVRVDGVDRQTLSAAARVQLRRRLAFVPQDPLDSFPRGASGGQILADALRAAGTPRASRSAKSAALAAEVGLEPDLLRRPTQSLSGGQRQRLSIARALARDPEVLLLDEPVSALDVTVQARVLDLLDEVQAQRGTTFLFVSHDVDVIHHMSDRVLRLENGEIARS